MPKLSLMTLPREVRLEILRMACLPDDASELTQNDIQDMMAFDYQAPDSVTFANLGLIAMENHNFGLATELHAITGSRLEAVNASIKHANDMQFLAECDLQEAGLPATMRDALYLAKLEVVIATWRVIGKNFKVQSEVVLEGKRLLREWFVAMGMDESGEHGSIVGESRGTSRDPYETSAAIAAIDDEGETVGGNSFGAEVDSSVEEPTEVDTLPDAAGHTTGTSGEASVDDMAKDGVEIGTTPNTTGITTGNLEDAAVDITGEGPSEIVTTDAEAGSDTVANVVEALEPPETSVNGPNSGGMPSYHSLGPPLRLSDLGGSGDPGWYLSHL